MNEHILPTKNVEWKSNSSIVRRAFRIMCTQKKRNTHIQKPKINADTYVWRIHIYMESTFLIRLLASKQASNRTEI